MATRFHANEMGSRALYVASSEGNLNTVETLIANGVDVNAEGHEGCTSLHVASFHGHLEIVKELIANGADVDTKDSKGCASIHDASFNGHLDIVKELIANGADVNIRTNEGKSPLLKASLNGHLDIVKELIANGAAFRKKYSEGFLVLASLECHLDTVMDHRPEDNPSENEGLQAAINASRSGHTDVVEYLLSKMQDEGMLSDGLDPNILLRAVEWGRMATTQKLVTSFGADLSQREPRSGLNAEDMAHMRGHSDVAWFLNKSTDGRNRQSGSRPEMGISKSSYGGLSLVLMQKEKGRSRIDNDVLDTGNIDLHFQDEEGMTLLHDKVKKNDLDVMSVLLERGALATALTHDGVTPIDHARREGSQEAVDMIESHIRKFIQNELKSSGEKCRYYTVMLSLILECVSISSRHKENDPMAEKERQEVLKKVSWLLSLGVPLEPPGNYHTHALHLAITSNCKPILTLLLAAGASLYATHNGLGPVEVAWLTPDVTTWIAVTVTRAVMNKLKSEVKALNCRTETDSRLKSGIIVLISELDQETPWQAKFSMPDKYLNVLLGVACEQGATLIAWWVWRAGGCCLFQQKKDGKTPLHLALDRRHNQTAIALIQYMEANAFLQDNEGRLPIDLFEESERNDVLKDALVKEYRSLDGVLQRAIDSKQKREAKEVILLLLTLFLVWKNCQDKSRDENEWKKFYISLISLLATSDDVHDTQNWILVLNEELKESQTGVQYKKKQAREHGNEKEIGEYHDLLNMKSKKIQTGENRDKINHFLQELDARYYTDDESDSLVILIDLLEYVVKRFLSNGQTLSSLSGKASRKINDRDIPVLLMKGLKMCSSLKLPLFLHLLVSKAKVNPRIIIEPITRTTVLHLAAVNGSMSASSFLLKNGASISPQDINGHTPSHFAYMHGHKDLGGLLNTHPEIASRNGLTPTDMWQAYNKYLNLYGLDLEEISDPRFTECNDSEELIQLHLKALESKWSKRGMREVVKEAKVDYTSGESLEVNNAIKRLLENLISDVGNLDSRFEGELVFVGSSADDVRLFTPDEYDCNVVLKNFSGYPDGGCQIHLQDPLADGTLCTYKDISISVLTEREDLKDLFEERNLLLAFYRLIKKCLPKLSMDDPRLSITLPSVKLTQVGVGLSFAWNGKEFPLLLIDVDVVPTMKAPWPPELEKTRLLPDVMEVYLNTVGSNEWRFSSAQDETRVMECLSEDEKFVFLACKLAMASLKTEGWMPHQVKDQFKYWDGRKLKIPLPKGFLLKNAFFFEKEEMTEPSQWKEDKLLERMQSIFKRMCIEMEKDNRTIFVPGKVPAYFGRSTETPGVGYGAPMILAFLQDSQNSSFLHNKSVRPKTSAKRK